jgi:uncharacterized protein YndB with AHSA1/START domain
MAASNGLARRLAHHFLTITRVFDAPPSLVFKVWSQPRHIRKWWGPKDFTVPACEMDFREGGTFRSCIRSPQGDDFWMSGVYREIDEPGRLAFTFAWEEPEGIPGQPTMVTVSFAEQEGQTSLTFHQEPFTTAGERDSHREGWAECLDRLDAYLERL